jgi:glycosyltransferase involved in cell wall biosynthesis
LTTTRRRIGSFLYHYPQSCGTTFAARGISRGLAHLGHDTILYCCGPGDARSSPEVEHLPNRRIVHATPGQSRNPFHVPEALLDRLRRNEDGLELLLVHGNFNPRNFAVTRAARQGGIPYVVSPSGLYHPDVFRKNRIRKAVYGRLFERPMLNGAVAIQVFMEEEKLALAKYGVRTPVFVVPNGFEPTEIPAAPAELQAEAPGSTPKLLYLGRIDMYTKGLDLLFEALAMGIREGKLPAGVCLDLVGPDWGDRAALVAMASRLNIADNIRFFGRVDDQTRWRVLRSTDIMILTSRHDAFPTTVVEAMAVAKPVILSEETGASSHVRDQKCGFLVKPNVRSICDGMGEAFTQRDSWQEMGRRAQAYAYGELVWDKVVERASVHYERILRAGDRNVPAVRRSDCAVSS